MSESDSVTNWIEHLKTGQPDAANRLWRRYSESLARMALRQLENTPRRAFDEEDVAISAFHAFVQGVDDGRFPELNDREDLWKVLVMLTERRVISARRREPTVPRTARGARGTVGPLDRHRSWSVLPGPLGRAGRTAGPLGRKTPTAPPPAPQPTPAGSQRIAGGASAATTPGDDPNTTCTPQAVPEIAAQQDQPGPGISPTGTTALPPSSDEAKHLDNDDLVATTGPTNQKVCRHGRGRGLWPVV